MNKEQALQLLTQVCAEYKGTLRDHQLLQEALQVLAALEEPKAAAKAPK